MKLEDFTNKKIKFYGKTRGLSQEEFQMQLKNHAISLSESAEDTDFLIEGKMLNPLEQNELDVLYEREKRYTLRSEILEKLLCENIEDKKLLMSLKLSNNQGRIYEFLTNELISDTLFLKLIKLYEWGGECFFESDANRDVTAALIVRFYENIERNHNVQFANMGLLHLLSQSDNGELIEVVASLSPLKNALKDGCDNSTMKILELIALHPDTPKSVMQMFVRSEQPNLHKLLSQNSALPSELIDSLEPYKAVIAEHITLDKELFDAFVKEYPQALAKNSSLDADMEDSLAAHYRHDKKIIVTLARYAKSATLLETLFQYEKDESVQQALANNPKSFTYMLKAYYEDAKYHEALAKNPSTPKEILEAFAHSGNENILMALAKNSATPVDTLYQLQLDRRFERAVKENEAFGKFIQSNNIGWEV